MELTNKVLNMIEDHTSHEVAFIGYRGSKHFNLDDHDSDIDLQLYTVPTIKDLLLSNNNKPIIINENNFDIHIDPLSILAKNAGKFSLTTVEALTLPVYMDTKFKKYRDSLLDLYRTEYANIVLSKNLFLTISYYVKNIDNNANLAKAYKFKTLSEYFTEGYIVDLFTKNDIGFENRDFYFKIRNGELDKDELSKLRLDFQKLCEKNNIHKEVNNYSKLINSIKSDGVEQEFQNLITSYVSDKLSD